MRRFCVTCYRAKENDHMRMEEPAESFDVFIIGLQPLQNFIATIRPANLKLHSKRWFGKRVNKHEPLTCSNIFNQPLYSIREVNRTPDNRKLHNGAIILSLDLKELQK